jgi:hypothetical protein
MDGTEPADGAEPWWDSEPPVSFSTELVSETLVPEPLQIRRDASVDHESFWAKPPAGPRLLQPEVEATGAHDAAREVTVRPVSKPQMGTTDVANPVPAHDAFRVIESAIEPVVAENPPEPSAASARITEPTTATTVVGHPLAAPSDCAPTTRYWAPRAPEPERQPRPAVQPSSHRGVVRRVLHKRSARPNQAAAEPGIPLQPIAPSTAIEAAVDPVADVQPDTATGPSTLAVAIAPYIRVQPSAYDTEGDEAP